MKKYLSLILMVMGFVSAPLACSVVVVEPQLTNPELVWNTEYIVLARKSPSVMGASSFELLEILKGEGMPKFFEVNHVVFVEDDTNPNQTSRSVWDRAVWNCGEAWVDSSTTYLLLLTTADFEKSLFDPVGWDGSRAIEPVKLDSDWLNLVRVYLEAEGKGKDAFLKNILENGERENAPRLTESLSEDIQEHLITPTASKSSEILLNFLDHPNPDLRIKAINALGNSERWEAGAEVLVRIRDVKDPEVLRRGASFLARTGLPEAGSFFLDRLLWAKEGETEEALELYDYRNIFFDALKGCLGAEHESDLLRLVQDDELAWEAMWTWWMDRESPRIRAAVLHKLDSKKPEDHPREVKLLANSGDMKILKWAEKTLPRYRRTSGDLSPDVDLAAKVVAFSPLHHAWNLRNKIIEEDGRLLAGYVEGVMEWPHEKHLQDISKIIEITRYDMVLDAIERGLSTAPVNMVEEDQAKAIMEAVEKARKKESVV